VSSALKLQVSSKVAQCDNVSIQNMRRDLEEAIKKGQVAHEREQTACALIQSLRLEILQLKRTFQSAKEASSHVGLSQNAIIHEADLQVDDIMEQYEVKKEIDYEKEIGTKMTPFQEWKMQKFLWAPDTPRYVLHQYACIL
jgi:hypothetical protein